LNRQVFPASLFPLRGDVSAEAGDTSVEVIGLVDIPIQRAYLPPANYDTLLYDATDNIFYFANPWDIPIGQVLEFTGYGYGTAALSWLASDTIAVGDGTPGDVSGGLGLTALILFGPTHYGSPYGYGYDEEYGSPYDQYYTTLYSGATQDWTMTLPSGPGTTGYVLATNGAGITYWTPQTGGGGSGFTYTVTSQNANYAAVSGDDVWCNGTFTVTLPALSTVQRVKINNRGTGTITIVPSSGLINGASSVIIARQYDSFEFSGDGVNIGVE
jgi:hypothetical protein